MADVYSTELLEARGLTGSISATAAVDQVWVLRCFDAYNGGGASSVEVFLEGELGQTIFWAQNVALTGAGHFQWQGRHVINPLHNVTINAASGTWDVSLMGYVLSAP